MQGKPIQGFEEDYYITENGDIIDLQTGKLKSYYIRGNETKPRVDLYKEGILQLSMYVEDVLVMHFFGKFPKGYYTLKYKDNDVTNLSLSNLEIGTRDNYETKVSIKKPNKIYELTVDGPVLVNREQIEEVKRINYERSMERERKRVRKDRYVKKIPAKDTPEYQQRKMKQMEEDYIKSKVKQLEEMSIRDGVKCTVTYEDLKGRINQLNYACEITRVPLTFERKKDNTISVKRIGGRYEDITLDNIMVMAKRVFF
jgi:hypothetical protein